MSDLVVFMFRKETSMEEKADLTAAFHHEKE